jgi:hypothetical protein
MSAPDLRQEALAARMLLEAMRRQDGDLSDEDADCAVSSETSLDEALDATLLANALDAAHVEALKATIATLDARMHRKQARITARKGAILGAMEFAGLQRKELATATLSVNKGRPVVLITDEDALPVEFWRERATIVPDKAAIAVALEIGPVAGATMSNAMPVLRITSK